MSLKSRINDHISEAAADFLEEEVKNTLEILNSQNDDLSGISKLDATLILRLVDDSQIYIDVENAIETLNESSKNDNPFDF